MTSKTPSARQASPTPKRRPVAKVLAEEEPEPQKEKLSLKEQIALRRAEAKKAGQNTESAPPGEPAGFGIDDDPLALNSKNVEDDTDSMGRWSIRETIERARSSGTVQSFLASN